MNINKAQLNNSKTYWSTITWTLLHTFPKILTNELYLENKDTILSLLYNICISVPCPVCAKHASMHLKKYNYFNALINKNITDLEMNIFNFHNKINSTLSKPIASNLILKEYENVDFLEVYKEWSTVFNITTHNLKLYSQKQIINNSRTNFITFVNKNYNKLNIRHTKIKKINSSYVTQSPNPYLTGDAPIKTQVPINTMRMMRFI
jgi:hypothetical protein